MYEIPVVGGGQEYVTVFNAIAAWTGGGGYRSFLQAVMVLSLGYAVITLAFNLNYKAFYRWFLQILCVYLLLMVPTVSVRIDDKTVVSGSTGAQVVDNVPIGLGALASFTTQAGFWLTRTAETLFTTSPERNYYQNGYIFGAKMFQRSNDFAIIDPKTRQNAVNFTKQCVLQSMALGYNSYSNVLGTTDLITSYRNLNYGALGAEIIPRISDTSVFMPCDQAVQELQVQMFVQSDIESRALAQEIYTNIQNVSQRYSKFLNDFPVHSNAFLGSGPQNDSLNYLRQVSMVKMFNEAWAGYSDANSDAFAVIRSDLQARNTYASIANQAMTWVPVLYVVLSIVYFAMFPVIFPLFLLPSTGVSALRGYAAGFFYLAAWGPLYAIIHMFIMSRADSNYQNIPSDGLTLANYDQILTVGDDLASMAGFLLLSVPVLAAALAKGAMNVAGHSAALLRPAQGAAEIAATESTTGNYAFGNVQHQNLTSNMVQANKFDTQSRTSMGSAVAQHHQPDGSVKSVFGDGSSSFDSSPALGRLPFNVQFRQALQTNVGNRLERAKGEIRSTQSSISTLQSRMTQSGTAARRVQSTESGTESSTTRSRGSGKDRFKESSEGNRQSRDTSFVETSGASKTDSTGTTESTERSKILQATGQVDGRISGTVTGGTPAGDLIGSSANASGNVGLSGNVQRQGRQSESTVQNIGERNDRTEGHSSSKGVNDSDYNQSGEGNRDNWYSRLDKSNRQYARENNLNSREEFEQHVRSQIAQKEERLGNLQEQSTRLARYQDIVNSKGFEVNGDISQPVASLYEEYRASNPGDYLPSATATNVSAEENALRAAKLQEITQNYVGGIVDQELSSDATAFDNRIDVPGNLETSDLGRKMPEFSGGFSSGSAGADPVKPLADMTVSPGGGFGGRRNHNGIDIATPVGTPIRAPLDGKVIASWNGGDGGQQMRVRLADGSIHGFAHLSNRHFEKDQAITQGDIIGRTGNTGRSTGPHLHYTVEENGKKIDPRRYYRR